MEPVETPGGKHKLKFTKYEYDKLRLVLKREEPGQRPTHFDLKAIDGFISDLEKICTNLIYIRFNRNPDDLNIDLPAFTFNPQKDLPGILKDLKRALSHVKALERGQTLIGYPKTLPALDALLTAGNTLINQRIESVLRNASFAREPLEALVFAINEELKARESEKVKKGRPSADHLGFVKSIAAIYRAHFNQKPATTQDGVFAQVVKLSYKAAGLKATNPRRAIFKALNE